MIRTRPILGRTMPAIAFVDTWLRPPIEAAVSHASERLSPSSLMPAQMNNLVASALSMVLLVGAAAGVPAARAPRLSTIGRSDAQTTPVPRFEDYPSNTAFSGRPARVLFSSARYGRTYRSRLRNGARKGPNFAGAFTIVTWACGSSCQVSAVINARTGALSRQMLRTTNGVEYRRDSRLLIADPVHAGDSAAAFAPSAERRRPTSGQACISNPLGGVRTRI